MTEETKQETGDEEIPSVAETPEEAIEEIVKDTLAIEEIVKDTLGEDMLGPPGESGPVGVPGVIPEPEDPPLPKGLPTKSVWKPIGRTSELAGTTMTRKTTSAMNVPGGVLVLVSTMRAPIVEGAEMISESTVFVPGVRIGRTDRDGFASLTSSLQ